MGTVRLRNTNPMGDVYLHLIGKNLEAGEEFDVDASLAGRAPSGTPGDDDYDQGEGLLAQVGNYELAKPAKKTAAKKTDAATTDEQKAGDQS